MREGWTYKKLGEVATLINGFAFQSALFQKTGLPIVRISNIQDDKISSDFVYFNRDDYNINFEKYEVLYGDILIAMSGATTGKVGINYNEKILYLNQRVGKIVPKENVIHRYLFYYLKTNATKSLSIAQGVAQPNLSTQQINSFVLPVPPLPEQERIVSELDLLSSIIEKKKAQLEEYDNLAQSIFYEMFGDPITNEKGWEIKYLEEIADSKIGLTYKPTDVEEHGTIVLRSSNIQDSTIDLSDIVRVSCNISKTKYVKEGDILMCSRNGSFRLVGKVARIKGLPEEMTYGAFMTIIRSCYNDYLFHFFKSPAFRVQLGTAKTATINQITVKMLNSIKVGIPPLELQQQFAEKIEAIEKQKEQIKQSIAEVETLFNSRMDYYFG